MFIVPALVGIVIGILSGLLGIGGGTVMVPVFRLLFNLSPIMSTATSLFAIIPTSISGAFSHIRHKTCIPSLGIAAGLGGALTSPFGVWLATLSPAWLIMVVAALIIGWSAVKMISKAIKMKPEKITSGAQGSAATSVDAATRSAGANAKTSTSKAGSSENATYKVGVSAPAAHDAHASDAAAHDAHASDVAAPPKMTRKQLLTGVAIGLVAGVASGYVGVGGGFIMVPLMLSLVGIAMRQASGTSLIAVMILAIPGVVEQGLLGNINYVAGLAVSIGSIPGALVGARLVRVVPERMLRFIFGGFLIVAAVVLALNEFGVLG